MDISEMFPSPYLRAADLASSRSYTQTIGSVEMRDLGTSEAPESKPVMSFVGAQKMLILNKTNAMALAAMYGPDSTHWIGKEVVIEVVNTTYMGQVTPGIRIKSAQVAPAVKEVSADDSCPF